MPSKNIGFNRKILLLWLDAAASLCAESQDPAEIRTRLDAIIQPDLTSPTNRRKTIDILLNIWLKTAGLVPHIYAQAIENFPQGAVGDRLWLHYGLTLVAYPFFREVVAAMGQTSRFEETITFHLIQQKITAELGQLGSLKEAVYRVFFSLRDWNILSDGEKARTYCVNRGTLKASSPATESWLLACALHAHPAEELPFADLLRLPELFPFSFTLTVDDLRNHPDFAVQRQGVGWEMVRLSI
ncbi:MAG TPA: hypothetical protein VI451_06580 [Anaerolineales bacterium]|nr:hypothetical protein [Anaerolineales bacterium]